MRKILLVLNALAGLALTAWLMAPLVLPVFFRVKEWFMLQTIGTIGEPTVIAVEAVPSFPEGATYPVADKELIPIALVVLIILCIANVIAFCKMRKPPSSRLAD